MGDSATDTVEPTPPSETTTTEQAPTNPEAANQDAGEPETVNESTKETTGEAADDQASADAEATTDKPSGQDDEPANQTNDADAATTNEPVTDNVDEPVADNAGEPAKGEEEPTASDTAATADQTKEEKKSVGGWAANDSGPAKSSWLDASAASSGPVKSSWLDPPAATKRPADDDAASASKREKLSGESPFQAGGSAFANFAKSGATFAQDSSAKSVFQNSSSADSGIFAKKASSVFGAAETTTGAAKMENIKNGEEDEVSVCAFRAKLYRLNATMEDGKMKSEWKELGTGMLKINKLAGRPEGDAHPRMVMRQGGVLRLILNAPIYQGMPIESPTDKMLRIPCKSLVDDPGLGLKPGSLDPYLFKFSRIDERDEVRKHLTALSAAK